MLTGVLRVSRLAPPRCAVGLLPRGLSTSASIGSGRQRTPAANPWLWNGAPSQPGVRRGLAQAGPGHPDSRKRANDAAKPSPSSNRASSSDDPAPPPPSDPAENPFARLPDLRGGIPSTLDQERAQSRSALTEFRPQDDDDFSGRRTRNELPDSAYVSSSDRRQERLHRWLRAFVVGGLAALVVYMGRNWDPADRERHADVPNGWGIGLWWNRFAARLRETMSYYHDPAFDKLLPEQYPAYARPYTLVIALDDVLVHNEWTREHGWRLAKRPGLDYFIRYLSQYYELIVFTTTPSGIADTVIRKLDPYHFLVPLYREATKWKDGSMVKDLSYLNRDLSKVIVIESDPSLVQLQPENAIILPKWKGDPGDKELVALIPFLEYLYTVQSPDVRKVLRSFDGKHIPTEFARREAVARREFDERRARTHAPKSRPSGVGSVGSIFGLKPAMTATGDPDTSEAFAQGKMLQDIARERGQRNYELIEEEIQKNGKKWLEEEQEMQDKAQKEFMSGMMGSVRGRIPFLGSSADDSSEGEKKS